MLEFLPNWVWYIFYLALAAYLYGFGKARYNRHRNKKMFINKHVLITGGSEGLGLSLAKLCFYNGSKVTIVSRSVDKLDKAVKEIQGKIQVSLIIFRTKMMWLNTSPLTLWLQLPQTLRKWYLRLNPSSVPSTY